MLPMIRDLFAHQAWADSEMWRYLGATPAAHTDKKVLELLGHTHAVQRFFLSAVQGEPLTRKELTKEIPLPDLRDSYREFHIQADRALSKMRDSRMKDRVVVPWFPDFQPTVSEALTPGGDAYATPPRADFDATSSIGRRSQAGGLHHLD